MPGKRYSITFSFILGIALVIMWFSSAMAEPVVKGRVLNNQGNPASGYPVAIQSLKNPAKIFTVYTNSNGDFVVYGLGEGKYRITPLNQPPGVSQEINVSPKGVNLEPLKLY
jgi:hypothetical protein